MQQTQASGLGGEQAVGRPGGASWGPSMARRGPEPQASHPCRSDLGGPSQLLSADNSVLTMALNVRAGPVYTGASSMSYVFNPLVTEGKPDARVHGKTPTQAPRLTGPGPSRTA